MRKFSYSFKDRLTPRHDFIMNFCGKMHGQRVLDIGSGFGWFEKLSLKKQVKKVTGLEPNANYLKSAKEQVTDPRVEFIAGSAEKLPFNKAVFDKVIMLEVLEHLPKGTENIALDEINRVLVNNGELILSTPNNRFYAILLDPAWLFGHRHYSVSQVKKFLSNNNFVVKEVFIYGGFWEIFRMIPHYFFKWILGIEDPFKKFFEKKMIKDKFNPNNSAIIYFRAVKRS